MTLHCWENYCLFVLILKCHAMNSVKRDTQDTDVSRAILLYNFLQLMPPVDFSLFSLIVNFSQSVWIPFRMKVDSSRIQRLWFNFIRSWISPSIFVLFSIEVLERRLLFKNCFKISNFWKAVYCASGITPTSQQEWNPLMWSVWCEVSTHNTQWSRRLSGI